jgi:hypothetical protein
MPCHRYNEYSSRDPWKNIANLFPQPLKPVQRRTGMVGKCLSGGKCYLPVGKRNLRRNIVIPPSIFSALYSPIFLYKLAIKMLLARGLGATYINLSLVNF